MQLTYTLLLFVLGEVIELQRLVASNYLFFCLVFNHYFQLGIAEKCLLMSGTTWCLLSV